MNSMPQTQEKITVFQAKKESTKIPFSPFDDKTFVFETYTTTSHLQMYSVMVSHFILAIPLDKLTAPIRTFRRKTNLEQYQDTTSNYIILDLDNVKSEEAKKSIINYFKDFKVILGASRSHNGINNFRMKGILFTESIDLDDMKMAISQIHHDLQDWCEIDESVVRKVSYNAPILKNDIFLNNEQGKLFKYNKKEAKEHIDIVKKEYITKNIENYTDIAFDDIGKDIEADTMEKLCLKVFQTMGFQATKNNPNDSISFKHPSEKKSTGGYFWFMASPYTMHHANSTKTLNIFEAVRKLPLAKELMKKDINYDAEFLEFNTDTSVITVNEKYLEVTDEISETVQKFIHNDQGLLSIRSAMGTGKSTIIKHIIDECRDEDMKVLIVTNRISVAEDFGKKYNMKVYNQDHYDVNDSLICQYDSLWKYDIRRFDVVIMDEFISLMMHSRSNLNNNSANIGKFFGCFLKKLVIADAFLTGYENFLLSNKEKNIHLIDNTYRDPTTIYNYSDFNYFVDTILYHTQNHKVTISATSLNFINSLAMLLMKRGLKVVTLTADTPDSTKKLVYNLFEQEDHDKWDVLIYSPTLTVGVSNLNKVDYHFHYDSSISTDAISSIQMIKRTRKTKEIHLFIKNRINYLKTSYNDIRDEYMNNMGKNIEQNYLFDIDDYGESKLSKIGKNAIKIDSFKNILEFNHKDAMFWLMKYHFLNEPRIIDKTFSSNVLSRYQGLIREDKNNALLSQIDQFLLLNHIEKTELVMDSDSDKAMKALVLIDDEIKEDVDSTVKTRIFECALSDKSFIKKCKYYKVTFNYTKGIWDDTDVQHLVSQSVMSGKNDDLQFYNALIAYGQIEIFEEYLPKFTNRNIPLKHILEKCGYKKTKLNNPGVVGHRGFMVDKNVKELHGFIN
jgi:hypothetical protein